MGESGLVVREWVRLVCLHDLPPGRNEIRARAVDLNGFAPPEPRPFAKSGRNGIQVWRFEVA